MGFLQDVWNANTKYNPLMIVSNSAVDFVKGAVDFGKEATAPSEINSTVKYENTQPSIDSAAHFVDDLVDDTKTIVSDGWDDVKDKIGFTPVDTAYNIITNTDSVPHKTRTVIVDTANNLLSAGESIVDDTKTAVKKYWPFAAAAVVGVIALKAAAPQIVKKILN